MCLMFLGLFAVFFCLTYTLQTYTNNQENETASMQSTQPNTSITGEAKNRNNKDDKNETKKKEKQKKGWLMKLHVYVLFLVLLFGINVFVVNPFRKYNLFFAVFARMSQIRN